LGTILDIPGYSKEEDLLYTMPGPPVRTILTSDDIGLGSFEMKVKGTFTLPGNEKFIISKFLFISPEEEQTFMDRNPEYRRGGYVDVNDPNAKGVQSPIRGRRVPQKPKDQIKAKVLSKGGEIKNPPPKPKIPTNN
jgi:hypothetical protein